MLIQKANDIFLNQFFSQYLLESTDFLYKRKYSKRKNLIKITGQSVYYRYNRVRNDYFVTFKYGIRTFFKLNIGIIKAISAENQHFPLVTYSLLRKRLQDLWIFEKHLVFKSNIEMPYRNLSVKLMPFKHQLSFITTNRRLKPLNKLVFFPLFREIRNSHSN